VIADAIGYHHATRRSGYMWLKMYQRKINPPGTPRAHARMYFITISRVGLSNLLAFRSGYQIPISFHHTGPMPSQMIRLITEIQNP
jgi:hypothetical protein